jgi:hypothetical protein
LQLHVGLRLRALELRHEKRTETQAATDRREPPLGRGFRRAGRPEKIIYTRKKRTMTMKTNTHTIALALLALGATALLAGAQDNNNDALPGGGGFGGGPGGPRGHRRPPLPIVMALDTNRDGIISADEIAKASAALLTLDKNSDGQLTVDEYMPPLPKDAPADAPKPPMPLIVKALDANGDGVIDAAEIANAAAALKTLDKNNDGNLTRDEFLGKRPGPPHGGGNGGNEAGGPPPDDAPMPPAGEN